MQKQSRVFSIAASVLSIALLFSISGLAQSPDPLTYVIKSRVSGKVLDVEGASLDDGARVIQYTGHGGANQQWRLRAVPMR